MLPRIRWLHRREVFVATKLPTDPVEQAELLSQFAGLWIALWHDEVVATAPTIDMLYRALDDKELPSATVFRVPDPRQGVFVG